MGVLDDVLHGVLVKAAEEHPDLSEDDLSDLTEKAVAGSLPEMAELMWKAVSAMAEENLFHSRLELEQFTRRNVFRWRKGFDLLDMLGEISLEIGQTTNGDFEPGERPNVGCRHRALTRLHAKACQIFREIVCLLKNGFADGALARWRALHEVATIACLLGEHGDDLAKRFLEFRWIESWQSMRGYQDKAERLGLEPFSQKEVAHARTCYDEMIRQYGRNFSANYGWAASVVSPRPGSDWVTFADIERAVELDHLKPYYRWACQKIHVGCNTLHDSLGLSSVQSEKIMMAGPSNAGHADPAHLAAISLHTMTTTLTSLSPSLDTLVGCKLSELLVSKIGEAFLEAQKQLEQEEAEIQGDPSRDVPPTEGDA